MSQIYKRLPKGKGKKAHRESRSRLAVDVCGLLTTRPGRFTPGKDPVPIV
jgi:hypothetical protein